MIILHRKFPPGGVVGQFLRKCSSTDNDVEWANIPSGSSLPDGGTTGQALRKASNADQDVSWQNDPSPFPSGGSTGNILQKTNSGVRWRAAPREVPTATRKGVVLVNTSYGADWSVAPLIYTIDTNITIPTTGTVYISHANVYGDDVLIGTLSDVISDIQNNVMLGKSLLKIGVVINGTYDKQYLLVNIVYNGDLYTINGCTYFGSVSYLSYTGFKFVLSVANQKLTVTAL